MKQRILLIAGLLLTLPVFSQREITDTVMGVHDNSNDITIAKYSLGGRRLITGSLDRTVHFYESTNWIELISYSHYDEITAVAVSRDDAIIASASKDNILKVYFLDSAKFLEFKQDAPITDITIDFGMRFLYTASSDGNIRPYDLRKGEFTKRTFPVGMPINSLCISHTNMLYAGLDNGQIKVLNYLGKEAKVLDAHTGSVTHLHFIFWKNQMRVASAGADNLIKVWDAKTYKEVITLSGHSWTINSVELSRDLKYVASSSNDGTSRIWDLATGKTLIIIPSKGEASTSCSLNENNEYVATTSIVREPREFIVYIHDTGLVPKPKEEQPDPEKPGDPETPEPKKQE